MQLDQSYRGFSFQQQAALDMRMNMDQELTAADIVNKYPEKQLADLIYSFGGEGRSRKIAKMIVDSRRQKSITTTLDLENIIYKAYGPAAKHRRVHPATKTFQALRIEVNRELEDLEGFLSNPLDFFSVEAKLCVLAYHSLEDRLVKNQFKLWAKENIVSLLTKKPHVPSEEEIRANRRARSAKMRVCEFS